jgi:hypothetical protein
MGGCGRGGGQRGGDRGGLGGRRLGSMELQVGVEVCAAWLRTWPCTTRQGAGMGEGLCAACCTPLLWPCWAGGVNMGLPIALAGGGGRASWCRDQQNVNTL